MKKLLLLVLTTTLLSQSALAQINTAADIEGRLEISPANDSTSIVIGREAGDLANTFNGSRNTFLGFRSGRSNTGTGNTFLGVFAGRDATIGNNNVCIGSAGANLSGNNNTLIGNNAGVGMLSGSFNTFNGHSSGNQTTTGRYNSFFGYRSGNQTRSAEHCVAIGAFALYTNRENDFNVAIGDSALYRVEDDGEIFDLSFKNTAIGASSLFNKNGFPIMQSVGIGYQAGYHGGDQTVSVGYRAGYDRGANSVFLGFEAGKDLTGTKNNRLVISNRSGDDPLIYGEFNNEKIGINTSSPEMTLTIGGVGNDSRLLLSNGGDIFFKNSVGDNKAVLTLHSDDDTYLDAFDDLKFRSGHNLSQADPDMIIQADGDVGIGIGNPTYKLHVDGAVRGTDIICTSTSLCSDVRFKKDFVPLSGALDKITQLQGYTHFWRTSEFPQWKFSNDPTIGFKAQDLQKIIPAVVQELDDGYLTVDYGKMVPVLVEALKEQQAIIEGMKSIIREQNNQFEVLFNKMASLENQNSISSDSR